MVSLKRFLRYVTIGSLLATAIPFASGQTFEIGGQQPEQTAPASKNRRGSNSANGQSSAPSGSIGWGSSIEVGRMARAAETALAKGDTASAATYAERAVQAAPQDAKLWFLLGYASRLAGRYPTSSMLSRKAFSCSPDPWKVSPAWRRPTLAWVASTKPSGS